MTAWKPELVAVQRPEQDLVECSLGIRDGVIALRVGSTTVRLSAEQADQMSADLRMFALELRNGGPVA